jgi:membrane fusion protein (multidrug efflux system)
MKTSLIKLSQPFAFADLSIFSPIRPMKLSLFFRFNLFLIAVALSACGKTDHAKGSAGGSAHVQEVGVVTLAPQRVAITEELPGRTTAFRISDVRPQVNGIILKRMFTEGSEVREGQQLYQIDPATYQAAYDSAKAALAKAEATLAVDKVTELRQKKLAETHVIAPQDYDTAFATMKEAEADVALNKASVETAEINKTYTKVLSPISGRIGRSLVTEGALVTNGQTAALATVQQLDPIYVDLTQSSSQLLRLQRELNDGQLKSVRDQNAEVRLILEDGTEYPEKGTLQFSEVSVDQGTGSVTLRAVFPNPRQVLLPGMFVRAQIEEGVNEQAILVPQRGVTRNQRGEPTALVVGVNNKVELRRLQTERTIGENWLVTNGLSAGDKVIIEGLQKVAPGAEVKAVALQVDGYPVAGK